VQWPVKLVIRILKMKFVIVTYKLLRI